MIYNLIAKSNKEDKNASLMWLGVILFIVFTIMNTSQFGASLSWMIVPCCVIIMGASLTNRLEIKENMFLLFLLWTIYLISTLFSSLVEVQRDIFTFLILCFIYLLVCSYKHTRWQLKTYIKIYIFIGFYCSLKIIFNWLNGYYYVEWTQRASFNFLGVNKDPNYVTAFVVPSLLLAFIKMGIENNKKKRTFYFLMFFIGCIAIVVTGSRAAMVSIIIPLIVFVLGNSNISKKKKIYIILAALIGLMLVLIILINYLPPQAIERLLSSSDDVRLDLWKSAIKVFKKYPILGGGFGAASVVSLAEIGNYSHNVYVDILCDSGLTGFFVFVLFFYLNCLKSVKKNRLFLYCLAIAFMLPMFFINGFNTATFYMPLILLSIFSKYCNNNEHRYQDIL